MEEGDRRAEIEIRKDVCGRFYSWRVGWNYEGKWSGGV